MGRTSEQLRRDALRIWQAAVDAVRADRLVRQALRVDGQFLVVGDEQFPLDAIERIVIVGAGKAGAGMAAGAEDALGTRLLAEKQVTGWVNVPENCVRPLRATHLHPARPPGVNEPTPAAVAGTERILRLVGCLGPRDLCLCLISGGGSALLPAPAEGITLEDKLAVTRFLSGAGATIDQLNTVRKQLSRVKAGGLARACRARWLVTLIISDVLGDPLSLIASGPTVPDPSTPEDALAVLEQFDPQHAKVPPRVYEYLRAKVSAKPAPPACRVMNLIVGNNATAVDAAGRAAERLGYRPALVSAAASEGEVEPIGVHLAEMALRMRDRSGPDCLVSGGEPVVRLAPAAERGLGGRNQQLVLAAAQRLWAEDASGLALLSGGTDGEDGPTDAAGAVLDATVIEAAKQQGLEPGAFLARNDAYHFFHPLGALVITGPTHTNVCDVRVVVVDQRARKRQ